MKVIHVVAVVAGLVAVITILSQAERNRDLKAEVATMRTDRAVCDSALYSGLNSTACPEAVQDLVVQNAMLKADLDRVTRDQAAAITRAETRGQNTQKRKSQNEAALSAAPVSDGLIVCNADCLRQRFEDPG